MVSLCRGLELQVKLEIVLLDSRRSCEYNRCDEGQRELSEKNPGYIAAARLEGQLPPF